MRKITTLLLLLSFGLSTQAQSLTAGKQIALQLHRTDGTTSSETRIYIYVPWDYFSSGKKYPVIFFYPGNNGVGAGGSDMTDLLTQDLPYQIDQGKPPYSVDGGDTTRFIVTTYQPSSSAGISSSNLANWVNSLQYYGVSVDTTRVYFMGASQGGGDMLKYYAGSRGWVPAAYVSMNPNFSINTDTLKKYLANIPAWFFQDDNDGTVGQTGTTYYTALHGVNPDGHKLTQFVGSHQGPERTGFYDPAWSDDTSTRTQPAVTNTSIYDWAMLFGGDTTEVIPDTPSYKIPISPEKVFWNGDTSFYQVNDVNFSHLVDSLFDEQGADPLNGINTPAPQTTFTSGSSARAYYPATAVIDLGGIYKVTHEFLWDSLGTDTLCIQYGSPEHWSTDTLKAYENAAGAWKDFGAAVYTRYLKVFYKNKGYQKVRELILYGYRVSDTLSTDPPENPTRHRADVMMHSFVGVNVYGQTPPEVRDVAGTQRKYTDQSFIDNTSPAGTLVDSVKFSYTNTVEGAGSVENYYFPESKENGQTLKTWNNGTGGTFGYYDTLGIDLFWALKSAPEYALDSSWGKSIDYDLHPGATGNDPADYDRLSRMAWTLGATYGKNHYPIDSVQKVSGDTATGTGTMRYIESGNENNGSWLSSSTQFYTPRQAVAYNSAFYDGNGGSMGVRMGIKTADDSIKVLLWGDASGDYIGYLRGMKYWAYYTRSDHSLPFDIWNLHSYFYDGTRALSPETYQGGVRSYFKSIVDTAHALCPSCEVWLSEWGYDRNRHSPLAVPVIAGKDSAQIQADWIARGWIELSFSGLDRAQLFQIQNDPLSTQYDSLGYVKFNTTGLTDGHTVGSNYLNYYAYPAYYFQHTIWRQLAGYQPDSIIYENHDSIWVYRYRSADHPDSVAYAIWSGTQINRSTDSFAIVTGHPNTAANIVLLQDKQMDGVTSPYAANEDGVIPIVVNETPKLVFTTAGTNGGQLVDAPEDDTPTPAEIKKVLLYLFGNKLIGLPGN